MTRKHRKNKKGGFLGMDTSSWSTGLTGWTSGLSNSTSSWMPSWGSKKEQSPTVPASTPYVAPPTQPEPQPQPQQSSYGMGGKKRRTRRGKRGGSYSSNMSQTNLAATASPVSGIKTVSAQTWVGGKTKRRRHRHNKSCKHKK